MSGPGSSVNSSRSLRFEPSAARKRLTLVPRRIGSRAEHVSGDLRGSVRTRRQTIETGDRQIDRSQGDWRPPHASRVTGGGPALHVDLEDVLRVARGRDTKWRLLGKQQEQRNQCGNHDG